MKSKLILAFAIIVILFGLYGLATNLSNPTSPANHEPIKEEPKIRVWKLNKDVHPGEFIERNMLSVENIPESEANGLGFVDDVNLDWKAKTVFKSHLSAGSLLTIDDLVQPDQDGYIDFIIDENKIPFPIIVTPSSVIGGVITNGSLVDILALTGLNGTASNFGNNSGSSKNTVSITPIISAVKVLLVKHQLIDTNRQSDTSDEQVTLVVELTRKQAVVLTVAQRISEIEVHKSSGYYNTDDLSADAGDILKNFKAITEYRADTTTVK
ncbi:Flp pilus assembly protein CpaB [Photobacterium damselae subsp. damselae]|uniref:Flp pilus assembly protein CpaB n=1 Tax=Photobacterium damselae TaxID=38293 RepID=UPI000D05152A|nr:Flp pilus assembly protein CpaB [Photobacterium damselae]PSB90609.1 Flp pilus assembly protein CpaB [Photobacterium damselae subsp. damselae]